MATTHHLAALGSWAGGFGPCLPSGEPLRSTLTRAGGHWPTTAAAVAPGGHLGSQQARQALRRNAVRRYVPRSTGTVLGTSVDTPQSAEKRDRRGTWCWYSGTFAVHISSGCLNPPPRVSRVDVGPHGGRRPRQSGQGSAAHGMAEQGRLSLGGRRQVTGTGPGTVQYVQHVHSRTLECGG